MRRSTLTNKVVNGLNPGLSVICWHGRPGEGSLLRKTVVGD